MLLRFRVANHRSIRDEQQLSLVAVPGRGEQHPRATQIPPTVRVAGIYGANASGKSNVLDALEWMQQAIRGSQASWKPEGGVPRIPFAFDEEVARPASLFEVDFIHDGVRHTYGFEVDDEVVRGEWLLSFPKGHSVRLFERTGPRDYAFGRVLTGEKEQIRRLTRTNALYLSSAAANDHAVLGAIHHTLMHHILFAHQNEAEEQARLRFTVNMLADDRRAELVNRLLRFADLGIDRVTASRESLSSERQELLEKLVAAFGDDGPGEQALRETMEWSVDFQHGDETRRLPLRLESAGTRAWLALIGPLLVALTEGHVLVIDELDASLHPLLSSTMIRMFKDPEINRKGAQLIFASHDTTLLGSLLDDDLLARDEVWFTAKDPAGATELFALAEFHPRRDENVERGYLQGRYGAVPYVNLADVRKLSTDLSEAPEGDPVR